MPVSRSNRRGVVWLVVCVIIISYSPRVLSKLGGHEAPIITFEKAKEIEQELMIQSESSSTYVYQDKRYTTPKTKFDPNTYSLYDWMSLGLTEKQAASVVNYCKYGVHSNKDLEKIYTLPKELFELIKDSTIYDTKQKVIDINEVGFEKEEAVVIELNTASIADLESLPGIGPFYANKIIEFRNKLGGFNEKEQLLELWKFDQDRLTKIDRLIKVDIGKVDLLSVNNATFEELNGHPYISYSVANSIVKMRSHEPYNSIEEIKRSKIIEDKLFEKIKPYLKL